MERVGFIGLGAMGKGMAQNIIRAGFDTTVYDISPEPVRELTQVGAKPGDSIQDVASASEVVIVMVYNEAQVEQVTIGDQGVLQDLDEGSAIVIMSTVSPSLVRRIAQQAERKSVGVLDAAVSGIPAVAAAGNLTIMVGGGRDLFERCQPVLGAMGKSIFHLGDVGAGLTCKLVNNTIVGASFIAVTEALAVGKKAGADIDALLGVFKTSTASSWTVSNWEAVVNMKKASEHGGGPMDMLYKDVGLFLRLAEELSLDVPLCSLIPQMNASRLP